MKEIESENFFEQFDENKLSEMITEAWKIADADSKKEYGKTVKKIGAEKAQTIAAQILDKFEIEKGQPARLEYRADIVNALVNGNRVEKNTEPTAHQDLGYY
ncbi:MAG: hypothetical protein A2469_04475 [Candidatus Magasanikbacteria bacterium RIFOXYC2_FULL_40_16]|uniref:Uncharacterized protein n=3 Tax=Candidatus Magasanikiibacteriota TaxID=1752731 RepID=A0A1F6NES1_9BACT|nr:MAG: hypothetical protein A2224_00190 [Candidatus Magasanikbacteria bacterium RIFOXYA2_FULL_40_20]OGH82311.1 MAG: hypothetical protein A2373_02325 [Candidatus Magasanikbacteria bacterium RIFOXYB1_FULL_40_15]OGH86382.1 MAG: hypothetical protein A2301_00490 [Candidatus Magasanikbacteria bacterium RIFOXYB2_FULL_40_13]OGH87404.1 MAG: hypothetical protein A2206_01735 [Candidatus Magasanikbacteria bacterium RIFOXYA1_FULL_40_8]OGH89424.1 MAG: hypothetical protein A2469_04475 [Candidatus Magasanikba